MNDAKGRELKSGDTVLLPCRIAGRNGAEILLDALSAYPNGAMIGGILVSPIQVIRANDGDDTAFRIVEDSGKKIIK